MIAKLKTTLFLILLISISEASFSANRAAFYKKRGDIEYTQKQFPIAIDFYKKAIAKNPNYLPALISLGKLLRETEAWNNSQFYLEKAYQIAPKNQEVIVELAKTYFAKRDIRAAQKIIGGGLKLYPYNPDLNHLKSRVYLLHNRRYLAQRKLHQIIRSNPGHVPSYILLSQTYVENRQYEKAIDALKKSYLIKADEPDILVHIGRVKLLRTIHGLDNLLYDDPLDAGFFSEAIHDLENAKSFNRYHIPANLLLGKIHALTRNCKQAIPYFDTVLKNNPSHFETQYYKGYCSPKLSLKIYPELLANNSNDEILRYQLQKNHLKFTARREHPSIMQFVKQHYNRGKQLSALNQETQAFYEFRWASHLFPGHLKSNKELIRYYRIKSDFQYLTKTLQFLRNRTREIRYLDMYEQLVQERRNKIFYRAGISDPEKVRTSTPLFVFYFKPENPFGTYPDAGRAIANKLSFALSSMGRIRVLPEDKQNEIYESLLKRKFFGLGGYHNAQLAKEVKQKFDTYLQELGEAENPRYRAFLGQQKLRYIIKGTYRELSQGIRVNMEITDLTTGLSIYKTTSEAEGRGYLTYLAVHLANRIYDNIPFHGKVLKVKDEQVLVNLGRRDGLKKNDVLLAMKDRETIASLSVVQMDMDLAWVKSVDDSYNIFRLQPGDVINLRNQ